MPPSSATAADIRALTDVVTRLRRTLRRSVRTEIPWESRPVAQIEVLQSLRDLGTSRVGDVAERLRLAQSTVSMLLARLVDDGLVTRRADRLDRRASVVTLSAAGLRDLRAWDALHRRRLGRALRSLDADDRAAVLGALPALGRLVDALDVLDLGGSAKSAAARRAGASSR